MLSLVPVLLRDINEGGLTSDPASVIAIGDVAYFRANDGTSGIELWKSDGTAAGTVRVKDILPGSGGSIPGNLTNVGGTLFFSADDGTTGRELWTSDGTEAGTVRVKDIDTSRWGYGSFPGDLTNVGGTLFFTTGRGGDLWKSDGTAAGTVRVKDIDCWALTNVNGTLFFMGSGGLWKSDGTAAGTVGVTPIIPGSGSSSLYLTDVNGTLFFGAAGGGTTGRELWKSDGTQAGTVRVKDIRPGNLSSYLRALMNVGGTLFFRARDATTGFELWKSDGTEAGTVRVKDIRPGPFGSYPYFLTDVNGTLFFRASDGTTGDELWKSDGTEAGTVRVKDIIPGSGTSYARYLTNVNGTLFFSAFDETTDFEETTDVELWKSDGSEGGTVRVMDIFPGNNPFGFPGRSSPSNLTNVNGKLFFTADDGIHGRELWMLDTRPVLSPIADQTIDESDTLTLQVIGADFDPSDTLTYSLDAAPVGASIDATSGLFTWTANDGPASFPVTVRVTDSGSPVQSSTASFVLNVENVLPAVQPIAGPPTAVRGQPLAYSALFTDPGTLDTHTATIDWGDGGSSPATVRETSGSGSAGGSHVYTTSGSYTIALTVTDKDGSSATRTLTVTVAAASVEPDPLLPGQSALFVGGTTGDDRIQIKSMKNSTDVQVSLDSEHPKAGYEQAFGGLFSRIVVYGGAGNDWIQVENSITLPVLLDGGAGNDWLMGGSGSNILIGGEGDDRLFGNALRNLLIGGLGHDVLSAGHGQDILIGGTTDYDGQLAALGTVMREWERTDVEYEVRVEHLLAGGGLNGSTLLNRDTVHNDDTSDLLLSGSGLDLYFASLDDAVLGTKKKDRLIAV